MRAKLVFSFVLAASVALGAAQFVESRPRQAGPKLEILPVQGNVYMIAGAGANITVQIGKDGVLLVDTPPAALIPQVLAAIRKLSPESIRYIINTHFDLDHVGGNEALARPAVSSPPAGPVFGGVPATALGGPAAVPILAHENVLNRMVALARGKESPIRPGALPTSEYFMPSKDFFFNGEPIIVYHQPGAHTDGDSIVMFRRSDVLSAGDIFTPSQYPVIELDKGGSVQGIIDALNRILTLTIPEKFQEGGTYVIPGHGRISEEADVVEYRDMLTIIRDRVQDLIGKGMTLDQVKAARPTRDYDNEYGATSGPWTTDLFVEAVYKSLTQRNR